MTDRERPGAVGPLLLIAAAAGGSFLLLSSPRTPDFDPPDPILPLVEVETVRVERLRMRVHGRGEVVPSRTLSVSALVPGEVVRLHPSLEPGGVLDAGAPMIVLDRRTFDLQVAEARAVLTQAEAELRQAEGQHRAASLTLERIQDLGRSSEGLDSELATRQPELRSAEARVQAARAALDRSRLDAERTVVRAPFRALVIQTNVEVGQRVAPGPELAQVVGADHFWVRIPLPLRDAAYVDVESAVGRTVSLSRTLAPEQPVLLGEFVRLTGRMDDAGRQADALIRIPDPLVAEPPIQLGEFVEAHFDSDREIAGVRIPRKALRGGNQVYVVDDDQRLQIRSVDVAWGDRASVVVSSGLSEGESLVVSRLGIAVDGMKLDVRHMNAEEPATLRTEG
ncbi:MAG: efflux RND transporter periplasmic adaptor subunit [Myxococcota bacterium]